MNRITFTIGRTDAGWTIAIGGADPAPIATRTLAAHRFPPAGFMDELPLPALPAVGAPDALKAIADIHGRIERRMLEDKDAATYARYLFDALIGDAWDSIAAATDPHALLELALLFQNADDPLQHLYWEMIAGPQGGFFATGHGRRATVTRLVESNAEATPIRAVPRILFVVSKHLYDQALKPGAEIVSLLRDVEREQRRLIPRVVSNIRPQALQAAIRDFRPDVIHLIGHGHIGPDGRPVLEMRPEEGDGYAPVGAAQLVERIRCDGRLPQILVLSACNTAGGKAASLPMDGARTASFAAELVASGVPVVVGMSGHVSDLSCRLFTRFFGEALLGAHSLVQAAEAGRRAAFAGDAPPVGSIDWARPALFISHKVPCDFVPLTPAPRQDDADIELRFNRLQRNYDRPVFCGREEILDAFFALIHQRPTNLGGQPGVLALCEARDFTPDQGKHKVGRTRLLDILALEAIRSGTIPVMVGGQRPRFEPPQTEIAFAEALRNALRLAARVLHLPSPNRQGEQLNLLIKHRDDVATLLADHQETLDPDLLYELEDDATLTMPCWRLALAADLAALREAAAERHPQDFPAPRAVLLFDDVHLWGAFFDAMLRGGEFDRRGYGYGEGELEGTPVVITLAAHTNARATIQELMERSTAWLETLELGSFRDEESISFYERIVRNPHSRIYPDYSDRPFVINDAIDGEKIKNTWHNNLLRSPNLKRVPSDFLSADFYTHVMYASQFDILRPMVDEDIIKELGDHPQ